MTLSDWPSEQLATFWAGHSVLSATLSTLLLVGAGYLAFEARENYEQQAMTSSLAAGAFGGCVDHVLDIDVALSLVRRESAPPGAGEGKPLRWLRAHRDQLVERDPRRDEGDAIASVSDDGWRARIVDECVRRLMAGLRDWSPLLSQTRDGIAVLARLASLHNRLLELADELTDGQDLDRCASKLGGVQHECRLLALGLELGSGVPLGHHRPGVLPPEVLDLHRSGAPRSFRRLLGQRHAVSGWRRGRDGERALNDFRSAFGSELPARGPHRLASPGSPVRQVGPAWRRS